MSEDTHTPPQPIDNHGKETHGYWSYKPTRKLMVLVHGFMGNAKDTWRGLPQQLMLHREASGYDILSFDYVTLEQTADQSANQLQDFLDELMINPLSIINPSITGYDPNLGRASGFAYDEVVLVAHSLGAVVSRRMLLDQLTAGRNPWKAKYKLIWYAPAHGGARIELLITAGLSLAPWKIGDAAKKTTQNRYPVIIDLEQGSAFLGKLAAETDAERINHPEVLAPLTFWAKDDEIVFNRRFSKDKVPCREVLNVSHTEIVKINRYDQRLSYLLAEM